MGQRSSERGDSAGRDRRRGFQPVRSVERAGRVLEVILAAPPEGMRLTTIAEQAGLHKTTTLRLLRTLVGVGVINRCEETDRYAWDALRWLATAARARASLSIAHVVQDILDQLAERTGESAKFALPDARRRLMVFLAVSPSPHELSVDPGRHRTWPVHAGAGGKVWLAYQPEEQIQAVAAAGLKPITSNTITSAQVLFEDLAAVRERGYALSREEGAVGAVGVAVPIRDDLGVVVAAVGVAAPVARASEQNIRRWVAALRNTSHALTRVLYRSAGEGTCHRATSGPHTDGSASGSRGQKGRGSARRPR